MYQSKGICKDLQDNIANKRRDHDQILVVNLKGTKNWKYSNAIKEESERMIKDYGQAFDTSKAQEVGQALLDQFETAGVRYFFAQAIDEKQIPRKEALKSTIRFLCADAICEQSL